MTRIWRTALLAGLLFAGGFAYARFWWGPGPEALERQRREVQRLGQRLERRLREQARLRDGTESVLLGVPAGVAERLVGEALARSGSEIRITLRGLTFHKTDEVRARLLLGRRTVGRFALNVEVHEVAAVLRPGQPRLRFGRDRVAVSLPVAIEDGTGRARLRFRWDGRGMAGAVCGDVDVTHEVTAAVPRHTQPLEGALHLSVDGSALVARPEFRDLELELPIEPDAEAWRLVDELIAGRGAVCRAALKRADIPDKLRGVLARGIRVSVPRRLLERPLRLPVALDREVTLSGQPLALEARPTEVMCRPIIAHLENRRGTVAKLLGLLLAIVLLAVAAFYLLVLQPQRLALATAEQSATLCGQQLASLRTQVADLTIIRDGLQRSSAELAQKVAEKEKELQALHGTQDELVAELKNEIADKTVQVEQIRDQLRVDMVDEVLFDSGEATLKPAGVAVLGRIGAVIAKAADRRVEVQGHTDNVPISGALAKRFPSNWELSVARATNVVRFLQEQAKLDPGRLSASGYAEFRPRGLNDTDAGRRRNRRIEILLVPLPLATEAAPEAPPAPAPKGQS